MKYKSEFRNQQFSIKFNTNNKYLHTLIGNFLDFDNNSNTDSKSTIKIDFYLKVINKKNSNKNEKFPITDIKVDYKKRTVRGSISTFEEAHKEHILDSAFMQPMRFILAHHGLFFLHASCVNKGGDCIVISGKQNSGKTTLALTFMNNGFNLLTDDDCFIKSWKGKNRLIYFPTKAGLTDKFITGHPEFKKLVIKNYRYGGKRRISLQNISTPTKTKDYRVKVILFPRYKAHGRVRLKRVSKYKALDRLLEDNVYRRSMAGYKELSVNNFWALHNLTNKTRAFEVTYNDNRLNEVVTIAQELL